MASSLSGVGQQQVSISQPFLPGGSEQNRVQKQDQEQRRVETQVSSFSSTSDSRGSERSTNEERSNVQSFSSTERTNTDQQESRRGSVVNLLV